jgi:hypothetical protein
VGVIHVILFAPINSKFLHMIILKKALISNGVPILACVLGMCLKAHGVITYLRVIILISEVPFLVFVMKVFYIVVQGFCCF